MENVLLIYVDRFNIYVLECNPWKSFAQEPFKSIETKKMVTSHLSL